MCLYKARAVVGADLYIKAKDSSEGESECSC